MEIVSLNYPERLPIKVLAIEHSFVVGKATRSEDAMIAVSTIEPGRGPAPGIATGGADAHLPPTTAPAA